MTAEAIQDEIGMALRRLADPVLAGDSVKSCLRRAAVRAGVPYGFAKRCWYREVKQIPAHLYVQIKDKAAAHDRRLKSALFANLSAMQESDPEFFREHIEALGRHLLPNGVAPVEDEHVAHSDGNKD